MKIAPIRSTAYHSLVFATLLMVAILTPSAQGEYLTPAFDAASRSALGALDRNNTGNLYVRPIASNDFAPTFLTFDFSGQSAASGITTLRFSVASVSSVNQNNTSSTPQTFTMHSWASDWNGASDKEYDL
jgi:hypothetical protein